ncbi:MAG TPA: deoxyribodipyrimidine photo-lyase, partial [Roseiflexaceae bacterium]|nr:deoxyribodipyrimidine photo-lyase [Roseiflexaceae bacterium]
MSTHIHWFRRDLRLHDNPALHAAAQASDGHVVPLFIIDDAILKAERTSAARVAFMLESLGALDRALRERGSRLVIRRGRPAKVLAELAEECGAAGVCWNRDYTPFAQTRDEGVKKALRALDLDVQIYKDAMIFEAGDVLTKAGKPYTVYAPYWKQWRMRLEAQRDELLAELPPPKLQAVSRSIESLKLPSAADLGFKSDQTLPEGGETAAQELLSGFVRLNAKHGIGGYHDGRERPALPATSRLSAYLRFGCIAPSACAREALAASERTGDTTKREGAETWLGELAWRDFYYQTLVHFPYVLHSAYREQYNALKWENDEKFFKAWCEGQTGYPIVDAAMRQLNAEAWMHNRARMIVSSFLVKDLLIDWRWGEQYFMQQL